jgi:putative ABC transport system ATP-binding protein
LLTIIGGLRRITDGAVSVLGLELRDASRSSTAALGRQLGFVFQCPSLLRSLTVAKNVAVSLAARGDVAPRERNARTRRTLEGVGLGDRADDLAEALSSGQQQRVTAARAMVRAPKLVLADEPPAALDGASGRSVVALMVRLARRSGAGVLLSTHDERIFDIADRRLHLVDGRLGAE